MNLWQLYRTAQQCLRALRSFLYAHLWLSCPREWVANYRAEPGAPLGRPDLLMPARQLVPWYVDFWSCSHSTHAPQLYGIVTDGVKCAYGIRRALTGETCW